MIQSSNFSDESFMDFCLELNDDCIKTMERFTDLKKKRKPKPFNKYKQMSPTTDTFNFG